MGRSTPQLGSDSGPPGPYRCLVPEPEDLLDTHASAHDRRDLVLAITISAGAVVVGVLSGILVVLGGQ